MGFNFFYYSVDQTKYIRLADKVSTMFLTSIVQHIKPHILTAIKIDTAKWYFGEKCLEKPITGHHQLKNTILRWHLRCLSTQDERQICPCTLHSSAADFLKHTEPHFRIPSSNYAIAKACHKKKTSTFQVTSKFFVNWYIYF